MSNVVNLNRFRLMKQQRVKYPEKKEVNLSLEQAQADKAEKDRKAEEQRRADNERVKQHYRIRTGQ